MRPAVPALSSPFADAIIQFIEHKRVLGRRYDTEMLALRLFDRYLVEQRIGAIADLTPDMVEAFLLSRPRRRPRSFNHLLGVMRRFFTWLVSRGHIPRSPVHTPTRRAGAPRIPFILSPDHVRGLLGWAARLREVPGTTLRGPTYYTGFAVLYALGLRVGEVCRLTVSDVDRRRSLLVIRDTKFGKDRLVPFGPRLGETLDRYLRLRRASDPHLRNDAPLFTIWSGLPLTRQAFGTVFRDILPHLKLVIPTDASRPRVHDLRHSFAVGTLLRWYRSGADPAARLLHLSTFLGHVQPESTAVYLTITADLLAEAGGRFEALARPLVTAVPR